MRRLVSLVQAAAFSLLLGVPQFAFGASAVLPTWKQDLEQAIANTALTGTFVCFLIDKTAYTYAATQSTFSDIPTGARIGGAAGQTVGGKTYTNGRFLGNSITYTAVTGNAVGAISCGVSTGTDATSRYVVFIDAVNVTPNGGDITINWDVTNGIFKL
jgi:hypothetical protein